MSIQTFVMKLKSVPSACPFSTHFALSAGVQSRKLCLLDIWSGYTKIENTPTVRGDDKNVTRAALQQQHQMSLVARCQLPQTTVQL